jgi:hypothetical protein
MEILDHLALHWRIILKKIKIIWQVGVDWFHLAQHVCQSWFLKPSNEHLGSIKYGKCVDDVRNTKHLKEDFKMLFLHHKSIAHFFFPPNMQNSTSKFNVILLGYE